MATATYVPIATTTVTGSNASTISFTSIPGTYTDLRLVIYGAGQDASEDTASTWWKINSDTGSNYSYTVLTGNGASASSSRGTSSTLIAISNAVIIGNATDKRSLLTWDLFNYAGSTYKTGLFTASSDRNGNGTVIRAVTLWQSTSAITSLQLDAPASNKNWLIGTTATLYGIKAA